MDEEDFAHLARAVAAFSRRGAVSVLLGLGLAGPLDFFAHGAASGCFQRGRRCRYDEQCCSQHCRDGWCRGGSKHCREGKMRCGSRCVNLTSDPKHCGACQRSCSAQQTCSAGACSCDSKGCDGCCEADACLPFGGQSKEHCGTDGAPCASCPDAAICNAGVCACPEVVCSPPCVCITTAEGPACASFTNGFGGCDACATSAECPATRPTCIFITGQQVGCQPGFYCGIMEPCAQGRPARSRA
jgi:stigma-specific protein Stig1